jgi:hypothetical protein
VVSEKKDGNFSYKYGNRKETIENKKRLFKEFKLDLAKVVEVEQIHGSGTTVVDGKRAGTTISKMDGLMTDDNGISLMVKIGDCIPVVIYDPKNRAVGLFHSGWRGTMEKIFLHGLLKMGNSFGTKPSDVNVWLGPGIKKCCYVTGKPPSQRVLPEWINFLEEESGKWHVDLTSFIVKNLIDVGVKEKNISWEKSCTYHEKDKWFSYARHKASGEPDGRFVVLVKLL